MFMVLNGFLKVVPPLAWATMVLALGAGFIYQGWRLDVANTKLGAATSNLETAVGSNQRLTFEFEGLKDINTACLDGRRADEGAFRNAQTEFIVKQLEIQAAANVMRLEEIEIYREPNCREFAQLDITAVCPDLARQWRRRVGAEQSN